MLNVVQESDAGSSGLGDWEAKGKAVKEERAGLMKRKAELDARVREADRQ